MDSKLRTCSCCGEKYQYCPKCQKDADKPTWYFAFCSENCKNIYSVASNFESGQIDATHAKEQLKKLDLSKLDNFGASYKNSIKKIMETTSTIYEVKVDVTVENTEVKEINDIKNEEDVQPEEKVETIKEVVDEEKVFKKPKNRKAKNNVE